MSFTDLHSFQVRVQASRRIPAEEAFGALQGVSSNGDRLTLMVRPGRELHGLLVKVEDEFGSQHPEFSGVLQIPVEHEDAQKLFVGRASVGREVYTLNLNLDSSTGQIKRFDLKAPHCG